MGCASSAVWRSLHQEMRILTKRGILPRRGSAYARVSEHERILVTRVHQLYVPATQKSPFVSFHLLDLSPTTEKDPRGFSPQKRGSLVARALFLLAAHVYTVGQLSTWRWTCSVRLRLAPRWLEPYFMAPRHVTPSDEMRRGASRKGRPPRGENNSILSLRDRSTHSQCSSSGPVGLFSSWKKHDEGREPRCKLRLFHGH